MEAPWQQMRILVDRFIYQGLRYVLSRHAGPDQDIRKASQDQDEKPQWKAPGQNLSWFLQSEFDQRF
jgi:hypothetical protein